MFAAVAFVLWIGCCALVGWLAECKGRNATAWVALALVLSIVFFNAVPLLYADSQRYTAEEQLRVYVSWVPDVLGIAGSVLALALLALLPDRAHQAARLPANT